MEKFSQRITNYLIKKDIIPSKKYELYNYGFQLLIEVLINTIISALIGILLHMEYEAIVFFTVFMPLRFYGGGLHLNRYISCLFFSCMTFFFILVLTKYVTIQNTVLICLNCFALIGIKILSPVQDINRPLSSFEKKKFGKKLNISILFIISLSFIFFLLNLNKLLLTIFFTIIVMIVNLVLGKIKYSIYINKSTK